MNCKLLPLYLFTIILNIKVNSEIEDTQYCTYTTTFFTIQPNDVGFPFVCCEYALLPLLNKKVALAYGRVKTGEKSEQRYI